MAIDQCYKHDTGRVKISHAQEPWQSLKWRYRLQHLKRIRWPEDEEPNKTSRVLNMKAKWVYNHLPLSKTSNLSQLLFKITTFLEERNELLVIDVGQDQYSMFVDELLSKCMTTITDPLPKNNRPLFSYPAVKGTSKGSLQLLSMKSEWNFYSRGYIWLVRQDMVMWISSSVMEIILTHYLCHWEGNYGLGHLQIHCLMLKLRQQHQKNPSGWCAIFGRCCCGSDAESRNS